MPLHPDFQKILSQFVNRYGDKEGTSRFYAWVNKRRLDETQPYTELQLKRKCKAGERCTKRCGACFQESFQWAKPLVCLLKQDAEAKYYEVEAHFAVTSMNRNIYSLDEELRAVHTLPGKHVDLNHNLEWIMKGVDIIAANVEDEAVEAILRVENGAVDAKGRKIQDALDSGILDCVSVECDSEDVAFHPEGTELIGMAYTGLALLDQEALPGIPLTRIMPLERIMESIFGTVESLETKQTEVNESMSADQVIDESWGDASFPDGSFAYVPEDAKGENGKKSLRKLPYKNKDGTPDIPHVRNALARLNQTDGIPAAEKDKIRNTLQNILAKENPDYTPPEAIPPAQQQQPPAPAKAQFCALCGSQLQENACPKEGCPAKGKLVELDMTEAQKTIERLTDTLTAKEKQLSEFTEKNVSQQERIENLETRNSKDRSKLKETEGRLREVEQRVTDRDKKIDTLEKDIDSMREEVGKLTAARETAIGEKNEALSKAASDATRASEEIKARSKIQRELAELREDNAKRVRKEGDLSTKSAEDAKKILDQETEILNFKEEIRKRENTITEQKGNCEKAIRESARLFKTLKALREQTGVYEVDTAGNVLLES